MSLAMVSDGTCYWPHPRCIKPVTEHVEGDMVLSVQIAHIRAAKPDGPRFVKEMNDHERRQFGNLILLCSTHHNIIDTISPAKYSIEILDQWKRDREGKNFEILKELASPDERVLQSLINDAFSEQNKIFAQEVTRFEEALAKLAAIDASAAGILKQRMTTANKELEAARLLLHTQDSGLWMHQAGELLAHTEDTAIVLLRAAEKLKGLEDVAEQLFQAAQRHDSAAQKLINAEDVLTMLDGQLERRINELRRMEGDY